MVVTKSESKREYASVVFLKWFTEKQNNIKFCVSSGYLPVSKAGNDKEEIINAFDDEVSDLIKMTLPVASDIINKNTLYTTKVFEKGTEGRSILENDIAQQAEVDRQKVLKLMDGGMKLEDAVNKVNTEENFELWYETTKGKLEDLVTQ